MKKSNLRTAMVLLFISMIIAALLCGCGASKPATYQRDITLAAICADSFPCAVTPARVDTFWEVHNFPVDVPSYVYIDTTECPPASEPTVVVRTVTVPARQVSAPVAVPVLTAERTVLDSAMRAALDQCEKEVLAVIASLDRAQAELATEKARKPEAPSGWLWSLVVGIVGLIGAVLWPEKKKVT